MKSKIKIKKRPQKAIDKLKEINRDVVKEPLVRVGLPAGSGAYPDGTSVIMVGATHEFGSASGHIPERSYLRSTMKENRKKYRAALAKIAKNALTGDEKVAKGMGKLALLVETDVKQKIHDIKEPTLKHRDGNPLVDTSHLVKSVIGVVE